MKTWIFAQPEATGSNGWAGKAMVAGLDLTSVDRITAFYEDDARLIADAPRLKDENEQLKLQIDQIRETVQDRYLDKVAMYRKIKEILGLSEKKAVPAPKKCEHGPWIPDGDRDVCEKCGTRANPTI